MLGGRRERMRAATVAEISRTARRLLVEEGTEAVTLRAIAREMGMTAPALYRYFPSRGDLVRHLVGDLYDDLTDALEARIEEMAAADIEIRFRAVAGRFRRWALDHPREYGLIFGAPLPQPERHDADDHAHDHADECGHRFSLVFMRLFTELWLRKPFPVVPDQDIDPGLRAQLASYRDHVREHEGNLLPPLPLGCLLVYLRCWVLLQGAVSLEVFGHLDFALTDPEPLFELTLDDIAVRLGL